MVTQEFFQVYLDNLSLAFSTVFISNFPTCLHIFKPTNIPPPSAETFYSTSQIIGEASEGNPSTSASAPRLSLDSERRVFPPVSGKALQPVLLIHFFPHLQESALFTTHSLSSIFCSHRNVLRPPLFRKTE